MSAPYASNERTGMVLPWHCSGGNSSPYLTTAKVRSSSSGRTSPSAASRARSSTRTRWRCSSTPARSCRPWARPAPDRRERASRSRCGHRLHHRRERVPRRAVLRRHPRVHRVQVRRPGRRRAGPADRAGRDAAGVRRLRDAGGRSGAADHQHDRYGRRHGQRADRRLGERPAAQGAADPRHHPDHPQRLADPGPDGVLGGDRAGHDRRCQRPARRLRRAADPDGQLRRQPLPRG